MTTARDKIAEIIDKMVRYHGFMGESDAQETADAILAALPDMIAPLVWLQDLKDPVLFTATTKIGQIYKVWDFDNYAYCKFPSILRMKKFSNGSDAQANANAHHRAQIMAAFKEPSK
jgi:hypothetical protein